ncbi:MAG: PH domain-containing protein [Nocardioidaceae bacterium]
MPAASEPADVPTLPHSFRPLGVRIASIVLGVMLFGITALAWLALPGHIRAEFNLLERAVWIGFGLVLVAIGFALARSRVVARDSGVTVVNGYRRRHYHWNEILAVSLRRGNPWAVLDLSDGTSVPAMGIQGSDGGYAVRQVRQLRRLVETMTRPE